MSRLFLLLCVAVAVSGFGQMPRWTLRPADLYKLPAVSDLQVSPPDGQWVAYAVSSVYSAKDSRNSDVWMVSADGKTRVQLTHSPDGESTPRWSPDGQPDCLF